MINAHLERTAMNPLDNLSSIGDFFYSIWVRFLSVLPTILFAIAILVIGLLLSKLAIKLMSKALEKTKADITIAKFLKSAVQIVLYVLLVTVVLSILGVPTASIIAVIGTAGVAIGLALQNSLSNLAGGFLILFSKPFKVGSYIKVSGEEGTVDCINILYTKLITVDNRVVYIPNGMAANAVCVNYNELEYRRVEHIISISYSEDFERAKASILNAISDDNLILKDSEMAPFVMISCQNTSSIDITVRVWCKTDNYWDVYFNTINNIRHQFIKDNISVPYNQLDVHIKND